ncbi:MAG TPA: hypothetical protein VF612_14895 [Jatrophihabitans sp.]|jgi:hypothetical protein|uniref:hypothetical protein n=1 Tax=Jatrophihabitans sp. TaxID=1932789 RepID=UPI002EE760B8
MIELPPPNQPPDPSEVRGRRGAALVAAAVVLLLVVGAALVNGRRNRDSAARQAADRVQQQTTAPTGRPSPGGPLGPDGGPAERLPVVACPEIRDEQSRLGYRCIDNGLRQDYSDIYLGLRIALNQEVEPGWVISEGSGNPRSLASPPSNDTVGYGQSRNAAAPALPSAAQVEAEVRRRALLAVALGYGDKPSSVVLAEHTRSFRGVQGFELVTEITINPTYRAQRRLKVRVERLWTVGLPTAAGVSIFMLSIPDNRADLWAKAEATVGTVHVL